MKKTLLFIFIFLTGGFARAQLPVNYLVESGDSTALPPNDTSLSLLQRYLPAEQLFLIDLGNPSSPAMPCMMITKVQHGFRSGIQPWAPYQNPQATKTYWKTPRPYTDIRYTQGQGRLLQLDFTFVRNITKRWNAGIEIRRLGSKGSYLRQNTDFTGFRMFHQYASVNRRWDFRYQIQLYNASSQINGGVVSDSAFIHSGFFQRPSFPVWLNSSVVWSRTSHQTFETDYHLDRPGFHHNDSQLSLPPVRRTLNLSLSRIRERNADSSLTDDFSFYRNIYKNAERNFDSITFTNYNATLTLKRTDTDTLKRIRIIGSAGISIDRISYNDFNKYDLSTYNFSVKGMGAVVMQHLQIHLRGTQYFRGYNQGDYLYEAGLQNIDGNLNWSLQVHAQKYRQAFATERIQSNHFQWAQTFNSGLNQGISGQLASVKTKIPFNLKLQAGWLQNLVIVPATVLPEQLNQKVQHVSLQGFFTWHYKKLYWHQIGFIQKNKSMLALHLPEWGSISELSLRGRYKKTSLHYQMGLVLDWRQKTNAWRFNPSILMWTQDSMGKMGGYPMVHFFATGEIKRFACFIRLEHILYSLHFLSPKLASWNPLPNYYFAAAGNPMLPQLFRFGFRWRFYD